MQFAEIVSRVTGFSTPIFGLSWNPPESQVQKARRVVTFLEDRRVLYAPFSWEVPEHCISSVIQMRHFLTAELSASGLGDELGGTLRAMRAACRKFLNSVGAPDDPRKRVRSTRTPPSAWDLNSALGELRGVFGIHLARLAVQYGLDIEHELVTILPAPPDETDA